jgi:hypothetical protein
LVWGLVLDFAFASSSGSDLIVVYLDLTSVLVLVCPPPLPFFVLNWLWFRPQLFLFSV